MGGVGVKDVDAQKFINAYAAFLKRQGKLPSMRPRTHCLRNFAC
jgi:ribosomal protein S19E (S16A)